MYWLKWLFLGAAFCFDVLLSSKIEGMCHSFWKFHCYVHVKPTIWFWFTVQVHMAMIETLTNKLQKSLDYGFQGDGNTKWPKVEGLLVLTFSNYLLPFIESTRYWWGEITGKEHAIWMKNDGFYEIDLWWLLFANALLSSLMCNRLQVLHLWSSFKHTSILVFCFAPSRFLINNALCQLLIARKILESHSK